MRKSKTEQNYRRRVQQVHRLIAASLDEPVDIATLAKASAFSLYHFHRIYTALMGETVADTHRRLRLDRAAAQIARGSLPITHIAMEAGYETPQSFSRAFKHQFSLSPAQYRKVGTQPDCQAPVSIYPPICTEIIKMNITIETREEAIVYGVRHIGPYTGIQQAFHQLWQWVTANHLESQGKCGIGIYYNDPITTAPEKCQSDACIQFIQPLENEPEDKNIRTIKLAAGRYARYRHTGPYNTLEQAYNTFYGQWLPDSGYECADLPPFEIYINSPYDTPEADLITDIYMPVKDK
ncbi:AraC family transcriptional regulator [Budviciaceae bacterium CWB-B4]|uniref:AraC family transcriptional regulator n=1 Tax=Limnobaculum xujianqingii TaxID=2738837 RepID=A0A9D7AH37_9GAMM|nr:AraC family transcriptional regulator [Limnobaculum xujianqingii]MBK5072515.1 AraC family transcriptional regulator [Limnobaculum xujianqingii]MBK5175824.1 AraC family transcriptional regulator [Limnobaculum xujianqingii]